MDFPTFFRSGLRGITIKSDRWRGLAALCKNFQVGVNQRGGNFEDDVYPVTGSTFTDRDVPLHVMQKPYVAKKLLHSQTLPAIPGKRYFLHSIQISVSQVAADAGTDAYVETFIDGASARVCGIFTTTLTALPAATMACTPDVLCDVNRAVSFSAANITAAGAYMHYGILGES